MQDTLQTDLKKISWNVLILIERYFYYGYVVLVS